MAQQYLYVVEDELFALPSLKQRKPKVCGESNSSGGGVDDRLTAKIVDLPHPRTGEGIPRTDTVKCSPETSESFVGFKDKRILS